MSPEKQLDFASLLTKPLSPATPSAPLTHMATARSLLQKGAARHSKKKSLNAKKLYLHLSTHWVSDLILEEIRLVKRDFLCVNTC